MKIAVVTCHNQPDYIRAVTLRKAISAQPGTKTIIIKNRRTGVLRYPEMIIRLVILRLRHRPDKYVLTFRGYELLPFVAILTWPKKLIYDELINPIEWLSEPRTQLWAKLFPKWLLKPFYKLLLLRCHTILTDTAAHSRYNSQLMKLSPQRFKDIPVGTDESLFRPGGRKPAKPFRVFYYGNMLPLHGLPVVLRAAKQLRKLPIEFVLIGGNKLMADQVRKAKASGARLTYHDWVPFRQIPAEVAEASLCLGGPFGRTTQADKVITGKTYQFLAAGAPVLIGQNSASGQFIDKQNCLTVPLGDASKLAVAIHWAYTHPKDLAQIGKGGRKLYEQHFSATCLAERMKTILAS